MKIADAVLSGRLYDLPSYLENAEQQQLQTTTILSSGSMKIQSGEQRTAMKQGNTIEWRRVSDPEQVLYEDGSKLTYYFHSNPTEKGVNILAVPHKCDTPCLVSSGILSGCVYAWFLVGDQIIFLHAGNAESSSSGKTSIEELRKRELADIFNGLKYALRDTSDPQRELEIDSLMGMLKPMEKIQCGQIIFPSEKMEKSSEERIAYMSYRLNNIPDRLDKRFFGGCYCSIIPQNQPKISGMLFEVNVLTENKEESLPMKVDPDTSTSKCCVLI